MKQTLIVLLFISILISCNNSDTGTTGVKKEKTQIDSLEHDIEEGHIVGMSKMGRLTTLQQRTKWIVDSIEKLPAKTQLALKPYKARLDSLLKDLNYADFAMNKWMEEYQVDSALNDAKQRVQYLLDEKDKVGKIKQSILDGINRADSVLRSK
jgi:hypothetical protein